MKSDTGGDKRAAETVAVTGDVSCDFNVYLSSPEARPLAGITPTRFAPTFGGAGITQRLLGAIAEAWGDAAGFDVRFAPGESHVLATSDAVGAVWEAQNVGKLLPAEKSKVWRLTRSLALGSASEFTGVVPKEKFLPLETDARPRILVVEDNAGTFRAGTPVCAWPAVLENLPPDLEWIVLKMTAPLCQGRLWWHLLRQTQGDRLVVILPIADLRREDVRISRGISWERTALEVAQELLHSPALAGLRKARHVIVTLHDEGAVWMQRPENGPEQFTLIFDPRHMEGEWAASAGMTGEAYGFMSCFTAAVAAHLAKAARADESDDAVARGIHAGLRASRLLRLIGHGSARGTEPGLPLSSLSRVVAAPSSRAAVQEGGISIPADALGELAQVAFTAETAENARQALLVPPQSAPPPWRILEQSDAARPRGEPLFGVARRVALYGMRALRNAPYARFGKLVTADRAEIEALRNIKRLIADYQLQKGDNKPLSIAVFGPPGAGKSFGIKQIAAEVLPEKTPFLEFNLSQFSDERDLIGAFHQVRDRVLEGFLPVVFWDEFDSQKYRWLQYLLAPMQDGKFQEGQITHPIGRCVFVFAGATTFDMENFGPSPGDVAAMADFRLKKGPDFASRLQGYLNVLGPNRRQVAVVAPDGCSRQWRDDASDVCFPVRRAILLRSILGLVDKREDDRLEMDTGLLAALLEVERYTHGSRSMEKILLCIKGSGSPVIRRSALPSDEVLAMNLDLGDFRRILGRDRVFQHAAPALAQAIHEDWRQRKRRQKAGAPFPNDVEFEELSEEMKAANLAAAMRIPRVLELAGLYLVPQRDAASASQNFDIAHIIQSLMPILAEEEHVLWMEVMFSNGWKPMDRPPGTPEEEIAARKKLLHHCLVPFAKLDKATQDYDREQVCRYPAYATQAGFAIVGTSPRNG